MPYCTATEVKNAISYPASSAPVADAVITDFVTQVEEEIEHIYSTKFGSVEVSSTATAGASTTLTDSTETWTVDQYEDYVLWIYGGTGSGQYRGITSNTATVLTITPAFTVTPDGTSTYRIVKLGYADDTVDGSGITTQFVRSQPLKNLIAATVDGTSVTTTNIYQYPASGKLILKTSAEVTVWKSNLPQLVSLQYAYGIYPLPLPIKRLAVILAGVKTLASQAGGTYDEFTSVSLPGGLDASKGEPVTNIRTTIERLQYEARGIVYGSTGNLTDDWRTSRGYRPYTLFG